MINSSKSSFPFGLWRTSFKLKFWKRKLSHTTTPTQGKSGNSDLFPFWFASSSNLKVLLDMHSGLVWWGMACDRTRTPPHMPCKMFVGAWICMYFRRRDCQTKNRNGITKMYWLIAYLVMCRTVCIRVVCCRVCIQYNVPQKCSVLVSLSISIIFRSKPSMHRDTLYVRHFLTEMFMNGDIGTGGQ